MSRPSRVWPRISPCRHCGLAVLRDNDGVYIHVTLSYACRDRFGLLRSTFAEPDPPAPRGAPARHGAPEPRPMQAEQRRK